MTPTIGRIVHYQAAADCGGAVYPAIITRVHESGAVDLATFGPQSLYFQFLVTEKAADDTCGRWFWPPRVP